MKSRRSSRLRVGLSYADSLACEAPRLPSGGVPAIGEHVVCLQRDSVEVARRAVVLTLFIDITRHVFRHHDLRGQHVIRPIRNVIDGGKDLKVNT